MILKYTEEVNLLSTYICWVYIIAGSYVTLNCFWLKNERAKKGSVSTFTSYKVKLSGGGTAYKRMQNHYQVSGASWLKTGTVYLFIWKGGRNLEMMDLASFNEIHQTCVYTTSHRHWTQRLKWPIHLYESIILRSKTA